MEKGFGTISRQYKLQILIILLIIWLNCVSGFWLYSFYRIQIIDLKIEEIQLKLDTLNEEVQKL